MGHRQPAPAFFSMAELPAPPAPVVPVVVAEEPAAGVVPADAELQPPPVVEAEVFSLNCFWIFSLFCSACFGPSVFIVLSACFVSWFSLPVRFCPFQFSVKYGNFGNLVRPSSENLYKISSNKEYNDTKTLAELCEELGFSVPRCSRFSERICKACGRNLRRTHSFYKQIKTLESELSSNSKDSEIIFGRARSTI